MAQNKLYVILSVVIFITGCAGNPNYEKAIANPKIDSNPIRIVLLKKTAMGIFNNDSNFVINCLSKKFNSGNNIVVIDEIMFRNDMFPFFEADEATKNIEPSITILNDERFIKRIKQADVDYLIWLSEKTDYSDKVGAMSCSLGLYGGGCFGYTAQEDVTRVEAEVWSVSKKLVFNRDSVTTKGKSQLLAFVIPIPIPSDSQSKSCELLHTSILKTLLIN